MGLFRKHVGAQKNLEIILGRLIRKPTNTLLKASLVETPLGPMVAIGDDEALHLLEFADYFKLEREIYSLCRALRVYVEIGRSASIESVQDELTRYFEGKLQQFKTPMRPRGSAFQQQAWEVLMAIPYGETRSYVDQAVKIGQPSAYRAVANANAANQLAIIIPCHRVIRTGGQLGGYGGGCDRKQSLLDHERCYK